MAKQGSILTFDEAKSAARRSRPSVAPSASQSRTKKAHKNTAATSSRKRPQGAQASKKSQASRSSDRTSRPDQSGKIPKVSKISEIRKSVSKNKAEKQFSKQFAKAPSDASQTGPRAAVYKTEMGRQHKKMTKMQNGSGSGWGGFLSRFSFVGFDFRQSPKLVGTTMVIVCLVLSCAFLYPTAQQFYITQREFDQVQAEYVALESRNNEIQTQVEMLSSESGIEDRAREEFGWVKEGEKAVTVHGLELDTQETTYKKSIPSGSVTAPSSWYTPILDVVFGVE